jgi:hypothetical protein
MNAKNTDGDARRLSSVSCCAEKRTRARNARRGVSGVRVTRQEAHAFGPCLVSHCLSLARAAPRSRPRTCTRCGVAAPRAACAWWRGARAAARGARGARRRGHTLPPQRCTTDALCSTRRAAGGAPAQRQRAAERAPRGARSSAQQRLLAAAQRLCAPWPPLGLNPSLLRRLPTAPQSTAAAARQHPQRHRQQRATAARIHTAQARTRTRTARRATQQQHAPGDVIDAHAGTSAAPHAAARGRTTSRRQAQRPRELGEGVLAWYTGTPATHTQQTGGRQRRRDTLRDTECPAATHS